MDKWLNEERIVFSTNSSGTTRYLHTKEEKWTPISHHTEKYLKQIIHLNIRSKTIKLLE